MSGVDLPDEITYNPVYGVTYEGADPSRGAIYRRTTPAQGLDAATIERQEMPTIWEDPAGKGYPCFERPMTPNEARETIDRLGQRVVELENEADRLRALNSALNTASTTTRGEDARLREAIEMALACTPSIRVSKGDQGQPVPVIQYDCGDPWEILRAALQGDAAHTSQEKGE